MSSPAYRATLLYIFKDPVSIARITAIVFIIAGVVLLNFSSSNH